MDIEHMRKVALRYAKKEKYEFFASLFMAGWTMPEIEKMWAYVQKGKGETKQ